MDDFLAYYTQDGSIGLYSKETNDIYHSIYGATTEAYDKFIEPAKFLEFFKNNNEIKILDICYGIGYNSKVFLNYFFENFIDKNSQRKISHEKHIETIGTNNILLNNTQKIEENNSKSYTNLNEYNYAIDANNISSIKNANYNIKINDNENTSNINCSNNLKSYSIKINAVDTNENLIKIAPLLKTKRDCQTKFKSGIEFIDTLAKKCKHKCKSHYKIQKSVNQILLINLMNQYGNDYMNADFKNFISKKNVSKFLDKKMLNFMKFYQSQRYKLLSRDNKSPLLHNIYYQYVSKSYKNTLKVLENNNISIRFTPYDARRVVLDNFDRYDYIFLDAFTPQKAPNLWTYEFIKELYNKLTYDGMLITYSNSASVRNALLQNNFEVGKIYNKNENKFTGTIASKNPELINYKLDDYDLGLIKSKAGIMYHDKNFTLTNEQIIENRKNEVEASNLLSSTQFIKSYKGDLHEDV